MIVINTIVNIKAFSFMEIIVFGILKITIKEISIIPRIIENMQVCRGISIFFDVFSDGTPIGRKKNSIV